MNDLARGIARDRKRLSSAFNDVLDSGYVVMGPKHSAFQTALAEYLGVTHVLGVASGTDALELAIKTVMPEGKDTVVTAANAGGYASVATKRAGYRVRYADVDADTLCMNLETLKPVLADDIGVVVVTHLYGNLTDITELVSYCHERGIRVVEDCAQAIGARLEGKAAGSFGDIAATSFYPTKNLGAVGDGGAIATSNDDFARRVSLLRQYGWTSKYHVTVASGTNSRLDELQAAILLARLPLLDGFNERRREIIARYADAAQGGPLRVLPAIGVHHVAHLAVALAPDRDAARAALTVHGVQTDIHFPVADHMQSGFEADAQSLPITERLSKEVLSLPCFPELTDEEISYVCAAIESLK
jgi:aminotransferase EvaB